MFFIADIGTQNLLTVGGIVVGALVVFWILRKIVKFALSLLIVLLIATAAVVYCVRAGYISREDVKRLNPFNSEQVRQAVKDVSAWAGEQAKDAAKKAISVVVDEAIDRSVSTNALLRVPRTGD